MAWIQHFTTNTDELNGSVDSFQQFEALKYAFEESTNTYFTEGRSTKDFKMKEITDEYVKTAHYYCCDPQPGNTKGPLLQFIGHPMAILGSMQLDCRFGPNRHQKKINNGKMQQEENLNRDHPLTSSKKKRKRIQDTMKLGCQAKIRLREVIYLKEVMIPQNVSQRKSTEIRKRYLQDAEHPTFERKILVSLPKMEDHDVPHLMGEDASLVAPISHKVLARLQQLAQQGVINVDEMKRHLDNYVERELLGGTNIPKTNRRYYPNNVDIDNHIRLFKTRSRLSHDDQENVKILVEKWKEEKKGESFVYRRNRSATSTGESPQESQSFLFIHQTAHQKYILQKYGNSLSLLDATYKTSKYDLPLFLLCVSTNVGYSVVATFIVEKETIVNIKEALMIIKEWNPNWKPDYFLVDFDGKEISAIESVFAECVVLICKFHRERCWDRWLSNQTHNMYLVKESAVKMLRAIANAKTEAEYEIEVQSLKDSEIYNNNEQFQKYILKTWLPNNKRWVDAYRNQRILNYINTTNGVESKHKVFKYSYLDNYSDNTIQGLVSTIVEKFIPDLQKSDFAKNGEYTKYRVANVKYSSLYRKYNSNLQTFLHDKPRPIVDHCIEKLEADIAPDDIRCIENEKVYEAPSETGEGMYTVDLTVPECSCPAWESKHLPCKHMLAVLLTTEGKWACFPSVYTQTPIFLLDTGVASLRTEESEEPLIAESILRQDNSIDHDCLPETSGTPPISLTETISVETPVQQLPTSITGEDNVDSSNPNSVPVTHKRASADSLRANCSQTLTHLNNMMFLTTDVNVLQQLKHNLERALNIMSTSIPTYEGLRVIPRPNLLKGSKKKNRRRILAKHKRVNHHLIKNKVSGRRKTSLLRSGNKGNSALETENGQLNRQKSVVGVQTFSISKEGRFPPADSGLHRLEVGSAGELLGYDDQNHQAQYARLQNDQNCCWFNSTIQALKAIVDENELKNTLTAMPDGPELKLLKFLTELQQPSEPLYNPDNYLNDIEHLSGGGLTKGQQHDAHEFVCLALLMLSERHLVSQVELTTQFMCIEKRHVHPTLPQHLQSTTNVSLAVDIDDIELCSIQDCMLQTIQHEDIWPNLLLGENAVLCRQCDKRCDTVERCVLSSCSKNLVIHLKRFRNNGSKITRPLTVNRTLDLPSGLYSLAAVQCHFGNSLLEGHYYTVCMRNGEAFNYDDASVFLHRNADQYLASSDIEEQCYILYYTRDQTERILYCLCKQPWDNRFMIECDTCKEWYHGSCVGVSTRNSQKLKCWFCPNCSKRRDTNSGSDSKVRQSSRYQLRKEPKLKTKRQSFEYPRLRKESIKKSCNSQKAYRESPVKRQAIKRNVVEQGLTDGKDKLAGTKEKGNGPTVPKKVRLNVGSNLEETSFAKSSSITKTGTKCIKSQSKTRVPVKERCPFCPERLPSMLSLRRHMYLVHYVCAICVKPCHSREGLKCHLDGDHKTAFKEPNLQSAVAYVEEVEQEKTIRQGEEGAEGFPDAVEGLLSVFAEDPFAHIIVHQHRETIAEVKTGYGDFFSFTLEQMHSLDKQKSLMRENKQYPVLTSPAFMYFILYVRDIVFKHICSDVVALNEDDFNLYHDWLCSIAPVENSE